MNIKKQLINLFMDLFNIDSNLNHEKFSNSTIKDWDSIGHVRLILAVSDEFKIDIPIEVALQLLDFNSLKNYIQSQLKLN